MAGMDRHGGIESYGKYRPGRSDCECQFDHRDSPRLLDREYGYCGRIGRMHDGMFMCGECWRRVGHRRATFDGRDPVAVTA